jgi:hypothetical protein
VYERQSINDDACSNGPLCVFPIFGPTIVGWYLTSSSVTVRPELVWVWMFAGSRFAGAFRKQDLYYVRAVRGQPTPR